jgi:hypothetical protein
VWRCHVVSFRVVRQCTAVHLRVKGLGQQNEGSRTFVQWWVSVSSLRASIVPLASLVSTGKNASYVRQQFQ